MKNENSICLAQIEPAEPQWSFASLNEGDFELANLSSGSEIFFYTEDCQFLLFDSASAGDWIKDEYVEWSMEQGDYRFSQAAYEPDQLTSLILYKVVRVD